MEIDEVELQIEEENDEAPLVEFDISVSPADPTLELLADKVGKKDIIVPFYQRKYVWKIEQASKLIESFLMGLPVPQVFLYVNEEDQLEIIDGQQRIMSVKYFFEGYFGEAGPDGRRQIFRLKGLAERSDYNGKTFEELSLRDQRRLRNTSLRAIHIKQLKPSTRNDSVFHIFERLNTGGTQLKPQEIRNAVYRGRIVDALRDLNNNPKWFKILGTKSPDKNQKDIEIILRLFALFEIWPQYEKPMLKYLNEQMAKYREFSDQRAEKFKRRFAEVVSLVADNLEKPFRPTRVINAAMLEGVMIALLEDSSITADQLKARYAVLEADDTFTKYLRGATTDTITVRERIKRAKEVLGHGAS
ncbi:DUF262 domain-containing protein [Novosphingobium sp. FSY-8]|uniref:DUF262 domain-containing protein n=1 Tax=Novosphingobium ovatum TaxID=1908523 RepID=A0ABW9XGS3_9SPHN|nr:DUF262 domain-containing protein [Novosphingobium ovatum]NBC37755.1 DUF262 domain-containing protein [Novosphingobium ovatum]